MFVTFRRDKARSLIPSKNRRGGPIAAQKGGARKQPSAENCDSPPELCPTPGPKIILSRVRFPAKPRKRIARAMFRHVLRPPNTNAFQRMNSNATAAQGQHSALFHRRDLASLLKLRGNQSLHVHIQSASQNDQFPIRDVAKSRFNLRQNQSQKQRLSAIC